MTSEQLRVNPDGHRRNGHGVVALRGENRMVEATAGESEARGNVGEFKIR